MKERKKLNKINQMNNIGCQISDRMKIPTKKMISRPIKGTERERKSNGILFLRHSGRWPSMHFRMEVKRKNVDQIYIRIFFSCCCRSFWLGPFCINTNYLLCKLCPTNRFKLTTRNFNRIEPTTCIFIIRIFEMKSKEKKKMSFILVVILQAN